MCLLSNKQTTPKRWMVDDSTLPTPPPPPPSSSSSSSNTISRETCLISLEQSSCPSLLPIPFPFSTCNLAIPCLLPPSRLFSQSPVLHPPAIPLSLTGSAKVVVPFLVRCLVAFPLLDCHPGLFSGFFLSVRLRTTKYLIPDEPPSDIERVTSDGPREEQQLEDDQVLPVDDLGTLDLHIEFNIFLWW